MFRRRTTNDLQRQMREDWDERARYRALISSTPAYRSVKYVEEFFNTYRRGQTSEEFFREGGNEAVAFMRPVLQRLAFAPTGKRVLDVGCGIGRSFPGFQAVGFSEIWGIDVSREMVEQGRMLSPIAGASFVQGDGVSLSGLQTGYFDYCFSFQVFEAIPDLSIVWRYLEEVYRVLNGGGAFQLHFRGRYLLKAKLTRSIPTSLLPAAQIFYHLLRLDWLRGQALRPREVPGSLQTRSGVAVSSDRVARKLAEIGFAGIEILADPPGNAQRGGTRYWIIGRKP